MDRVPPLLPPDDLTARRQALGEQLRDARLAAGLTQEQVALATGIDRPSVVRIERGQQDARLSTLLRLCDALGVRLVVVSPT
ncbi:helix-turn-helix transcriptional regulator [Streptomyces albidoflavus]